MIINEEHWRYAYITLFCKRLWPQSFNGYRTLRFNTNLHFWSIHVYSVGLGNISVFPSRATEDFEKRWQWEPWWSSELQPSWPPQHHSLLEILSGPLCYSRWVLVLKFPVSPLHFISDRARRSGQLMAGSWSDWLWRVWTWWLRVSSHEEQIRCRGPE